jgi:type II restriction enzyme
MITKNEQKYPILITEMKNQGTNDLRLKEGKKKQAKGNATERLGKNVIGFRTALLNESIFPFVCFGDGCDFAQNSSILDRVITISMFGKLNISRIHNEGPNGIFNRGSFYFRKKLWTPNEMAKIMIDIAEKSVYYYFSKYGENNFK